MFPTLADINESFLFPSQSSTVAHNNDFVFYGILWVCVFFFVIIVALMAAFVIIYRRKPGVEPQPSPSHNMTIEAIWSILPLFIVAVMFYEGFAGYVDQTTPPQEGMTVHLTGEKWAWNFIYPNGHEDNTLHVYQDENIILSMTSKDVLHSMYIPAFRVKRDVIPGQQTKLWFNSDDPGMYDIFCAEYCGDAHSAMISKVTVHDTKEDYETWLAKASDLFGQGKAMHEIGEILFNKRGCVQCHDISEQKVRSGRTGPPLYGIFGETHTFEDGSTAVVDEEYIRESLMDPRAKIVKGYKPEMPNFADRFKDPKEYLAVAEFIKSLSADYTPPEPVVAEEEKSEEEKSDEAEGAAEETTTEEKPE